MHDIQVLVHDGYKFSCMMIQVLVHDLVHEDTSSRA